MRSIMHVFKRRFMLCILLYISALQVCSKRHGLGHCNEDSFPPQRLVLFWAYFRLVFGCKGTTFFANMQIKSKIFLIKAKGMYEGMYEYCEERRRLSIDFKITGYILNIYRVRWDTVLPLLYSYFTLTCLND